MLPNVPLEEEVIVLPFWWWRGWWWRRAPIEVIFNPFRSSHANTATPFDVTCLADAKVPDPLPPSEQLDMHWHD